MQNDATARDPRVIAAEIIEHNPAIAIRVRSVPGAWETLFITENISTYGYDRDDFLSGKMSFPKLVHPDDLDELIDKCGRFAERKIDRYSLIYRIVRADGTPVWIADTSTVIRGEDGEPLYCDCVLSDYTEIKHHIDKVEEHSRQQGILNEILQSLHDSNLEKSLQIILDNTGMYLNISRVVFFEDREEHAECAAVHEWCNKGVPSLLDDGALVIDYARDIPEIDRGLRERGLYIVNYGEIPSHSTAEFEREGVVASAMFAVHVNGERYGFICFDECRQKRYWTDDVVCFLENISRLVSPAIIRKRNEQIIQNMALTDPLTGLNNRYQLETTLQQAMDEAREVGQSGYVLFIDMDDFKIINDGYGHDYGDIILKEFAAFLKSLCQDSGRVFRFGGDEFVVLLRPGEADGIYQIITGILTRAQLPWSVIDRLFNCTLSIGVVRYPEACTEVREIIRNADLAMYQAKRMGKNNYAFYTHTLDNDSVARAEIEKAMRESIADGFKGFAVCYQPIADASGAPVGMEALLRWTLPGGKCLMPAQFIQLAEYLGLIVPVGEYVLTAAAETCKRINAARGDFFASLNVSLRQFQQRDFMERVMEIFGRTGVNRNNIVFEITEVMAMSDIQRVKVIAKEFRRRGVRIAIDDFGTGYSALGGMRELPVDIVKLDCSIVGAISRDSYARAFIRSMAELVHSLRRKVCVEGVENAEQLEYCRQCSVDYLQGFHLGGVMSREELFAALGIPDGG